MRGTAVNGMRLGNRQAWLTIPSLIVLIALAGGCSASATRQVVGDTPEQGTFVAKDVTAQPGAACLSACGGCAVPSVSEPNRPACGGSCAAPTKVEAAREPEDSGPSPGPTTVSDVSGPKETIAGEIYQPQPQVLIDCTLVEVTKNDLFNADLNELRNSPDSARRSSPPSADPNASGRPAPGSGGRPAPFYYSDWQTRAILDVLSFRYEGRILAKPRLLVPNHHKGMVETRETTYVEVNPPILVPSGADSQTPAAQMPANYFPCEAGITLAVTPHICAGDLLQLDIVFTRSDFSKSASRKPPRILFSKADTTATLPDGCTVILGGMQKLSPDPSVSKVPILGDLPLMGGLFRSSNNNEPPSTLYLFVKAEVLGPAGEPRQGLDESTVLAHQNCAAFEADELEFQTEGQ